MRGMRHRVPCKYDQPSAAKLQRVLLIKRVRLLMADK